MRQTNYYSPNNCQDLSLSVSRISLPSVLRKGPLQHALQHLGSRWKKGSSLFKRPLATNLAKNTLFAPVFLRCAPMLHTVLQSVAGCCRDNAICHTGSAVSSKPVQRAFCAPAIQLLAGGGSLGYVLFFCCADIAHVVVSLFFLCRCLGLLPRAPL